MVVNMNIYTYYSQLTVSYKFIHVTCPHLLSSLGGLSLVKLSTITVVRIRKQCHVHMMKLPCG